MSEGSSQTSAPPPLDYVQRPRWSWMGRHRKLLITLAVCIAIAISIYEFGPPLKHRVLWLYWSHRLTAFQMPSTPIPAIIQGIDDPAGVNSAMASNPDYEPFASQFPLSAVYLPDVYRHLRQLDWRMDLGPTNGITGIVLMGTLRRPDGAPRLVVMSGGECTNIDMPRMTIAVIPPFGMFDPLPPQIKKMTTDGLIAWEGSFPSRVEFRTGQFDPKDPSHIVFHYLIFGSSVMLHDSKTNKWTRPGANQITYEGDMDAFLQNDDMIHFALRVDSPTLILKQPTAVLAPPVVPTQSPASTTRRSS